VAADERPRLAVRLTPDGLRQVRGGHPWVFEGSIRSVGAEGRPGDLAVVFDGKRRFAAIGLWDPGSPIRIKILHQGSPRPIDADFWQQRIASALALREPFTAAPAADELGYRVVSGENDGLPGLIADRYAGVLVVKVYSAAWLPHLDDVIDQLVAATGVGGVVLRASRLVHDDTMWADAGHRDGDVVRGHLEGDTVRFLENGLWFEADVRHGQKTGHFLDQRANRAAVRDRAHGKEVLDVFCSTGGFTVHAATGGALSVTSVDLSRPALEMVERNLGLNGDRPAVGSCRHEALAGDAFEVLGRLAEEGRSFDLVVVDPPSFAQRQADVPGAERAYRRLTRSALRVLRKGGTLVQASCSSRVPADRFFDLVATEADDAGRPLRLRSRTGHDIDHPVGFPEGAYLKAGFWFAP
jgi:23S rRNA (cytosine1962-C5)-methyltransferase